MPTIKRIKTSATKINGEVRETTDTHFAAAVAPAGNVVAWVPIRDAALNMDRAACNLVIEHYRTRPKAGEIVIDGDDGVVVDTLEMREAVKEATAETDWLRDQYQRVVKENERLTEENAKLRADLDAANALLNQPPQPAPEPERPTEPLADAEPPLNMADGMHGESDAETHRTRKKQR